MKNFYKGGRGLCLPDQYVETVHATSLRDRQSHRHPSNDYPTIRRGEKSFARIKWANIYLPLPFLIFICCLFNNAALAQSHQEGGAVDGVKLLQTGDRIPEELWGMPIVLTDSLGKQDTVPLCAYRGKDLLVIDFWATWCAPCVASIDKWEAVKQQFPDNIELLPIHMDFDRKAAPFLKRRGWKERTAISSNARSLSDYFFATPYVGGIVWVFKDGTVEIPSSEQKKLDGQDLISELQDRGIVLDTDIGGGHGG